VIRTAEAAAADIFAQAMITTQGTAPSNRSRC